MIQGAKGEQLSMFMDPQDIMNQVVASPDRKGVGPIVPGQKKESMAQMWDRKLDESKQPRDTGHGAGIHDSLSAKGYDGPPVEMIHGRRSEDKIMGDGHHRVAAGADIGGQLIPTIHYSKEGRPAGTPKVSEWHDVRLNSTKHAQRFLSEQDARRNWDS